MSDTADRLLTQGEVEREILRISEALEEETRRYADLSDLSADSEVRFKGRFFRAVIHAADADGPRVTVAEREARAHLEAEREHAVWKVNEARLDASKQALLSHRARLDALRTLAANIRAQT